MDDGRAKGQGAVDTADQTPAYPIREIEAAGFKIEPRRVATDVVSGSSTIEQRKGFMKLLDKLDRDDVLIVTKLDRLGRKCHGCGSSSSTLQPIGTSFFRQRLPLRQQFEGGMAAASGNDFEFAAGGFSHLKVLQEAVRDRW